MMKLKSLKTFVVFEMCLDYTKLCRICNAGVPLIINSFSLSLYLSIYLSISLSLSAFIESCFNLITCHKLCSEAALKIMFEPLKHRKRDWVGVCAGGGKGNKTRILRSVT